MVTTRSENGSAPSGQDGGGAEPRRPRVPRRTALIAGGTGALAAAGAATALLLPRPAAPFTVHEMLQERPFLVAHRGSEKNWPEMSLYGYEQCVAHGVRALELSVSRSSDGVWFGLHDGTLDRTSGTVGFVASEHTWAEIRRHRISAAGTTDPHQPSRPYLDLTGFLDRFGSTSVLFIDPKAVSTKHYPELLSIIRRRVPSAAHTVVAKSGAVNTGWAELARQAGLRSWGFYYGKDLAPTSGLFTTTQRSWDLLGLDDQASAEQWRSVTAVGKPVIGHVITTRAQRDRVVRLGARGVMCADVVAVSS